MEVLAWFFMPILFLYQYIEIFSASPSVIFPHLSIILIAWTSTTSIRLAIWKLSIPLKLQKLFYSLLTIIPVMFFAAWYAVIIIGLHSWGRIATWPLIETYIMQAPSIMMTLGLPKWILFLTLPLLVLVILASCKFSKHSWNPHIANKLSKKGILTISLLMIIALAITIKNLADSTDLHPQEPLSISMFSRGSKLLQNNAIAVSPVIDEKERQETTNYKTKEAIIPINIIFIIGDALRADHMSLYGYYRNTTPKLNKLLKQNETLALQNSRSICSESACGLMAIASSRFAQNFPSEPLTLYEVLRRHKYDIYFKLSGDHTNFYGLKETYGKTSNYFDGTMQNERYINDDLTILENLKEISQFDNKKPVLFQFHLMSTHGLGLRHKMENEFQPTKNYYAWPLVNGSRISPSSADIEKAINYYDNGVLQFDSIASEILNILESKGYLSQSLIVITGDHGEMLGEEGMFGHQHSVRENSLKIPLIFQRRGYSGKPLENWGISSQVDIAPTVLQEALIPKPKTWEGQALQTKPQPRLVYFQQSSQSGFYYTPRAPRVLKYWIDKKNNTEYAYNTEIDPKETTNVIENLDAEKKENFRKISLTNLIPEQLKGR